MRFIRIKVRGQVEAAGRCRARSAPIHFRHEQFKGVRYSRVSESIHVGFRLTASPLDSFTSLKGIPSKRKRRECDNSLLHFILSAT